MGVGMIAALVVHWQKSLRKSVDHLDLRTRWKREKEENGAIRARRQVFCSRLSCVVALMEVGGGAVAQPRAHGGPRCEFPAKARAVTVSIVHSMFSMSRVRKYVYIKKRGNTSTSTVKVHNADCQFSAFPVPSRLCRHIAAKVQLVH